MQREEGRAPGLAELPTGLGRLMSPCSQDGDQLRRMSKQRPRTGEQPADHTTGQSQTPDWTAAVPHSPEVGALLASAPTYAGNAAKSRFNRLPGRRTL